VIKFIRVANLINNTGGNNMTTKSLSHTKWKCQYHIVFIPKYRRKIMYGKLKAEIREILIRLCKYKRIEIVEGAVCKDHVHMLLSIPPKHSVSEVMGYLKGRSALQIFDKFPEYKSNWNKEFWAKGYYVVTVGDLSEKLTRKYIEEQEIEDKNSDKN
jgi:putative transposase